MHINFSNIRSYYGSQNNAFEELVCQLAHLQQPDNAKTFIRKEGAGGDAGIECYWVLEDASEIGWQVKYFTGEMNSSRWSQLDESFKTALEKHPNLKKYVVSLPIDKTDSRKTIKTKKTVSVQDEWDSRLIKWQELANDKDRTIEFEYWGKHELIQFLTIDDSMYTGRALFWFNEPVLGLDAFRTIASRSRDSLGERYTPESHIDLPVVENFDALTETSAWWNRLEEKNSKLIEQQEEFSRKFQEKKGPFLDDEWVKNLEALCLRITTLNNRGIRNRNFLEYINNIRTLCEELLSFESTTVQDEDGTTTQLSRSFSGEYSVIKNLFYYYREYVHFLDSKLINISDIRAALLYGEAGIGKSHLLCDVSLYRIDQNLPTVFLLGQHYEGGNPLDTLKGMLDLSSYTNAQVLGALDAAGEAAKSKTLIIIDAINEGSHRDEWVNYIRAFLTDISKYPNISVLLSCRTSYLDYMLPSSVDDSSLIRINHVGFQGYEHRAAEKYMSKQGISKPSAPILAPEFTNPLFLKTCCKALKEMGLTSFPKGLHGLTQLFDFFLQSVERTISKRKRYNPSEQIIKSALKEFASQLFPCNFGGLAKGEARKFINNFDPNENKGESLFDELLYEGILSEDISYDEKGESYLVVRFTYERFSDYFIAQQIVGKYNENTINTIFTDSEPLGKIIVEKGVYRYEGIFEALSIILGENHDLEMVDLLPDAYEKYIDGWVLEKIFTNTIVWRSSKSFTDRTLDILNNLHEYDFTSPSIEILLKLSTEPNHPWNADLLHDHLVEQSVAERDAFWSTRIALGDQIEEDGQAESIVRTLIEWSCHGDIKDIEKERARLTSVTLFWFLTTSNRKVRDQSTKSLVRLLSEHPVLLPDLLNRFHSVNDLYLVERLYAVAYGVVCNINIKPLISETASIVFDLVFKDEKPIPHVLLRDYARGILEYALHFEILSDDIDPGKFRPPYMSEWPIENLSKEDIDKVEGDEFSSHIKSSLMGFPGDFGNYTMSCIHYWAPTALSEPEPKIGREYKKAFAEEFLTGDIKDQYLEKIKPEKTEPVEFSEIVFQIAEIDKEEIEKKREEEKSFADKIEQNLNEQQKEYYRWLSGLSNDRPAEFSRQWAQRWVCARAHELGWEKDLFEEFEKRCSYGRGGEYIERIGKKYQWIALHELLARLSDNVHWIDRGYSDIEDKKYYGPWQLHKRDIDPTIWIRSNAEGHTVYNKETAWWQTFKFPLDDFVSLEEQLQFLWSETNLPDFPKNIQIHDSTKSEDWLVLKGFWMQIQNENVEKHTARLDAWFRINSIIIKKSDREEIVESIANKNLIDPHTVNVPSTQHQSFLGEYPWHNSCRFMSGWNDTTDDSWDRTINGKYLVPISNYEWESGSNDYSLDSSLSFYMPAGEIIHDMNLNRSKENFGAWCDDHGQVIFLDPSIEEEGPSFALVRKKEFLNWLEKNDLEIIWLIGGEKQLFKPHSTFYGRLVYNVLCCLDNEEVVSDIWFEKKPRTEK